ncbi:MAG: DUF4384 domain-containing protein [Isosphaeraceae bacterium]|nr:DUF4384 domain-containing protein [Isosphaeraceae bacterium]
MTQRRPYSTAYRLLALAAVLLAVNPSPSRGQAPPPIDRQAQNDRPKFLVRVSVDKEYRIYGEGESLTLKVRCEEDAYLYVLYQQADGKIFQIFPNSGQPDNRIKGKQDVRVPDLDDAFRWVVGPPFGHEVVKVIASKKPVDALSLPGLKEGRFNPVTVEQVEGAAKQLAKEPANVWSEHDLAIQTVRKGVPTTPPDAHKRFGVFFGVSDYEFNELAAASSSKHEGPNVKHPALDAEDMAALLKQNARLNDARLYRNAEATRGQMKQAITEWLPSVSRPGDTVFIFFAGHGTQVPDDANDEADGQDEVLLTSDFIDLSILMEMGKRFKDGTAPAAWKERFDRLAPTAQQLLDKARAAAAGVTDEQEKNKIFARYGGEIEGYLLRQTAVDDDEMGHWIQKLDGRHVVVIVMACHSGGLTPSNRNGNKGLESPGRAEARSFDFLKDAFVRLKDLDQPSLTVMTAAAEAESAIGFNAQRNAFYTVNLKQVVEKNAAPLDARQAHEQCKLAMAAAFSEINDELRKNNLKPVTPHVPQFFSTENTPVFLKVGH